MKAKQQTAKIATISMLTAISVVLYYLEFPILPSASHLKLDLSDIPALFAGIVFGPVSAVVIELLKNFIEFISKGLGSQMGFGNLMNFIVGVAYILPFSLTYKKLKQKGSGISKSLIIASVLGTISILIFGFLGNYIIAPLYYSIFLQTELTDAVLWAAISSATILNVIKGIMLSIVSFPLVSVLLKRFNKISF
ncbi:MAG: ECF transporter S component [Clostridia bacterium]